TRRSSACRSSRARTWTTARASPAGSRRRGQATSCCCSGGRSPRRTGRRSRSSAITCSRSAAPCRRSCRSSAARFPHAMAEEEACPEEAVVAEAAPLRGARILEAATALFAEHGYDGASMRELAARAGCSPANLYYHYRGKYELFVTL